MTPGHTPLIGYTMSGILGIPAPEHRKPFQLGGESWADLGELNSGYGGGNRPEWSTDTFRRVGFRIQRIVVTRSAQRPDEDALDIASRQTTVGQGLRATDKPRQRTGGGTELQETASIQSATMKRPAARWRNSSVHSAILRRDLEQIG
jgi:hypothetical protein